jgi:hypothetical protein
MRLCRTPILFPAAILATALVFSNSADGRWARDQDAPAHFDEMKTTIRINKDLSIERTDEFTATIDKQEAIADFSVVQEYYSRLG